MRSTRRGLAAALCVVLTVAGAGTALASAKNKTPKNHDYNSHADSSGAYGDPVTDLPLVTLSGSSSSNGDTDQDNGTSGNSWSQSSLDVDIEQIDVDRSAEADCEGEQGVRGSENGGVDNYSDEGAGETVQVGQVRVDLVWAKCEASAVKSNNTHSEASAGLLAVTVDDIARVEVVSTHSQSHTTSGQANSSGDNSLVWISNGEEAVSIGGCDDTAQANNGGATSTDQDDPASCADTTAAASHVKDQGD